MAGTVHNTSAGATMTRMTRRVTSLVAWIENPYENPYPPENSLVILQEAQSPETPTAL